MRIVWRSLARAERGNEGWGGTEGGLAWRGGRRPGIQAVAGRRDYRTENSGTHVGASVGLRFMQASAYGSRKCRVAVHASESRWFVQPRGCGRRKCRDKVCIVPLWLPPEVCRTVGAGVCQPPMEAEMPWSANWRMARCWSSGVGVVRGRPSGLYRLQRRSCLPRPVSW